MKTLLHQDFIKAQAFVEAYKKQMSKSLCKVEDLKINQRVKRNYPESWNYWVSEIIGEDVLIRTTEDEKDSKYDDFYVNISEIRIV